MSLTILGYGAATPPHRMSQQEATDLAVGLCCDTERQERLLNVLYRKSGVKNRHTVIPHREALNWGDASGGDGDELATAGLKTGAGPSTGERMAWYEQHAPVLARQAVQRALEQSAVPPSDITHLVTVSCTGFFAPGVDIDLIGCCDLPPTTQRTHVGFMGCHGALNGLRVAQGFVQSNPQAHVLLCAVECCTLHYQIQWAPERFVGNTLFADGAAAVVCAHDRQSPAGTDAHWRLQDTGSCLIPDSRDAMEWKIGDHGFEMFLSAAVPDLIKAHLHPWLSQWLGQNGTRIEDIGSWAIHPGGPRILHGAEEALGLTPDDTAVSRDVLAHYGNMSSPTILFIVNRLREQRAPLPCLALGFGPGLTAEAALFV